MAWCQNCSSTIVLSLLKIKNIALIDALEIEFGAGLNLLTGETGSGKSIIVDSLGALTGERVSNDLIKQGEESARIEGLFTVAAEPDVLELLDESGIEIDAGDTIDLIVRRELSLSGKNRVFVNNQLVTQGFLKRIGPRLADIHGQGEQASLYDTETHIGMLDQFADVDELKGHVAETYKHLSVTRTELGMLQKNEAEKLQLLDILRFQVKEIKDVGIQTNEDEEMDAEKHRLNNIEKVSKLSEEAFALLYENDASTLSTLDRASRDIGELNEYESSFREHTETLVGIRTSLEDIAFAIRDFRGRLEFSPERLETIDNRLAEISRLKRKYGGSIESILEHLRDALSRLENIESAEFREEELRKKLAEFRVEYLKRAGELHDKRVAAASKFETEVEKDFKAVALEKARFEVRFDEENDMSDSSFTAAGFDRVEFYFSANPGESPRPLAKVASGGEASRLMLILKTAARAHDAGKTSVFDEIDVGIGGRVAEAVGRKLKDLAAVAQVFCVTHQPQIAALADRHFVVEKAVSAGRTNISVRELSSAEKIEELARMLAGEQITDAARENARSMLSAVSNGRENAQKHKIKEPDFALFVPFCGDSLSQIR